MDIFFIENVEKYNTFWNKLYISADKKKMIESQSIMNNFSKPN